MIDGNKQITTPVQSILNALKQQLFVSGIDKLHSVEYKQNNARITCPIHKDGKENTPSCDVLLEDKRVGDKICFGNGFCGYKEGKCGQKTQ